jgi:cyclohexanecarboxylate-CoA ligase
MGYADLASTVDRFASALAELGVGRGDVVVLYLPNRWMLPPLFLACARVGAVASPVIPVLAGRELGQVLTASRAKVCVTVDRFNDVDYDARLAESAPDTLAHRVVVGDAARTGAVDFASFFEHRADRTVDAAPLGPDEPALLLYTSGTSGQMKGVVHSPNTLFAAARTVSEPHGLGCDDVVCVPNFHTHMAGLTYGVLMPLLLGGTCVVQDTNTDMALLLDLVQEHGTTWAYASPSYLVQLLDEQTARPRRTGVLRCIVSGSAPVQPDLVARVREVFGVPLHTLWGMTENGAVTVTRPDDPEGWGAHSDGRPPPWMRVRVEADGRLLVRGASQCFGYLGQRDLYDTCVDPDGWFDTGDLARDDGRGGIRITGRRSDLVTRASGQKVSTLEVETVLLRHPAIADVVLVGYPDAKVPGADLVCAVVVPNGTPPTLDDLHGYLDRERMAAVLWPDRVQFVWQLPRNALGKVLRKPLRDRLELAATRR